MLPHQHAVGQGPLREVDGLGPLGSRTCGVGREVGERDLVTGPEVALPSPSGVGGVPQRVDRAIRTEPRHAATAPYC